jgi:starch-binding outer membrane protein, SusD/RagB family
MKHFNKLYLGIAVILIASLISCESFLQKDPQGSLISASFPLSASDALLATNAVYATLRDNNFHYGLFPILDIMSDDGHKGSNPGDQATTIGPYDNFTFNSTTDGGDLDRWWSTIYEGVKRANVVIEKVPAIQMDTLLRNRYVAEACFLRGLFYFDLVRAWGGVPIVKTLNPPVKLARSTKDEVYTLIISDFTYALNNLPEKSSQAAADIGRATKGSARSYLAKVFLFQGDFVNAEKYAMDVINSAEYGLEPVFTDANSVNGEQGIESVFEIGASGSEDFEGPGDQYGNVQGVRGTPNRGWGFNRPTPDLRNSFEPGDPRLKGTIIDLGDTLDGVVILGDGQTPDVTLAADNSVWETECYNRKVWTPGHDVPSQFGYNRRLIRYADVLLMAAEASNENGKTTQALTYLNMVRARARQGNNSILPDITETDKNLLRDLILTERRHELALEGNRLWDLIRTNKSVSVLGPLGFVSGKHELLPIPQTQIDLGQGSLTQNPKW